jgi:hypothetical protein
MLYANTVMTVATICHVRKQGVWHRSVTELPTFGAPALTFDSTSDTEFDSHHLAKTNESEIPILGVSSRQSVDSRTPHHFRSRAPFPSHPPTVAETLSTTPPPAPPSHPPLQAERLSTAPSPPSPSPSDSVSSLVPSVSTQLDLTQSFDGHPRSSTGHRIVITGEPPTYSGPGSDYRLVTV